MDIYDIKNDSRDMKILVGYILGKHISIVSKDKKFKLESNEDIVNVCNNISNHLISLGHEIDMFKISRVEGIIDNIVKKPSKGLVIKVNGEKSQYLEDVDKLIYLTSYFCGVQGTLFNVNNKLIKQINDIGFIKNNDKSLSAGIDGLMFILMTVVVKMINEFENSDIRSTTGILGFILDKFGLKRISENANGRYENLVTLWFVECVFKK